MIKLMRVSTLRVGEIDTNCYIIEDEKSKEALIIDPGDNAEEILNLLNKHQLIARYIVNTHGHWDHIGANRELKERTGALLLIHELDEFMYKASNSPPADRHLKEGDEIMVGELVFKVFHTPGHTPGGISLYSEKEKVLFSGDTLFAGTYGRTDLPYSSQADMEKSLNKLLKLPAETKVYPGHGRPTIIAEEQNLL